MMRRVSLPFADWSPSVPRRRSELNSQMGRLWFGLTLALVIANLAHVSDSSQPICLRSWETDSIDCDEASLTSLLSASRRNRCVFAAQPTCSEGCSTHGYPTFLTYACECLRKSGVGGRGVCFCCAGGQFQQGCILQSCDGFLRLEALVRLLPWNASKARAFFVMLRHEALRLKARIIR